MQQNPNLTPAENLLGDLDAGVFAEKLDRALRDTALGVVNTGRKGKVIVTFDLEQIGESNQVAMTHAVKFTRPTPKGKVTEENSTKTPLHVGSLGKLTLFPETQTDMFPTAERRVGMGG